MPRHVNPSQMLSDFHEFVITVGYLRWIKLEGFCIARWNFIPSPRQTDICNAKPDFLLASYAFLLLETICLFIESAKRV